MLTGRLSFAMGEKQPFKACQNRSVLTQAADNYVNPPITTIEVIRFEPAGFGEVDSAGGTVARAEMIQGIRYNPALRAELERRAPEPGLTGIANH